MIKQNWKKEWDATSRLFQVWGGNRSFFQNQQCSLKFLKSLWPASGMLNIVWLIELQLHLMLRFLEMSYNIIHTLLPAGCCNECVISATWNMVFQNMKSYKNLMILVGNIYWKLFVTSGSFKPWVYIRLFVEMRVKKVGDRKLCIKMNEYWVTR